MYFVLLSKNLLERKYTLKALSNSQGKYFLLKGFSWNYFATLEKAMDINKVNIRKTN